MVKQKRRSFDMLKKKIMGRDKSELVIEAAHFDPGLLGSLFIMPPSKKQKGRYGYVDRRPIDDVRAVIDTVNSIRDGYHTVNSIMDGGWKDSRKSNLRGSSSTLRKNPTPGVLSTGTDPGVKIGSGVYFRIFPYPNDYADTIGIRGFNERDGMIIHYKGVKICRWFVNNTTAPVYVHYAIIQLKTGHYIDEINSEDTGIDNHFFRSYSESDRTDRQIDFTPYTNGGSAEAFKPEISCNPMNPDRFYKILFRRTWKLPGNNDPSVTTAGKNVKKFQRYFRINKMVHWRDTSTSTSNDVEMPFVEVWWTNYANPVNAGTVAGSNQVTAWSNIAYFRSKQR